MTIQCFENNSKYILAIHSTNDSYGFAYKKIINDSIKAIFFTKKLNYDLSNNLIIDLDKFLSENSLENCERISVSIGPANFNASRLIVVLARTLAQQIQCSLDSFSSFYIMANRIAIENKISQENQSFWIFNKLKNR